MRCVCLLMIVWFGAAASMDAADFYVDPSRGRDAGKGSMDEPWQTLQHLFRKGLVESQAWEALPYKEGQRLVPKSPGAPIKAGDTIWLLSGYYGELAVNDHYNPDFITIAALEGHEPRFRSIRLRSGSRWAFKGLHVSPEYGPGRKPGTLIDIESHGFRGPVRDVVVDGCVLASAEDTSMWSAEDWNRLSCNGIHADGTRITLRNNRLRNVNFGISVTASHSLIERNTVENFAGDGLRGLGDHCVFQYNEVRNCYDVNDNHDDGFQSWSRGPAGESGQGDVTGIVLRGNTIINYTDPEQPHRGPLQGIGCFDGMFVDWVIENNVVIVDHWHGITLLGARGSRIVNNTAIDLDDGRPGPPWVYIGNHKNGTASTGCLVRNNLSASVKMVRNEDMVADHNLIITEPGSLFQDASRHDLRLRKGSPAIGAGRRELAPDRDIVGTSRPQGNAMDAGAYEYPAE